MCTENNFTISPLRRSPRFMRSSCTLQRATPISTSTPARVPNDMFHNNYREPRRLFNDKSQAATATCVDRQFDPEVHIFSAAEVASSKPGTLSYPQRQQPRTAIRIPRQIETEAGRDVFPSEGQTNNAQTCANSLPEDGATLLRDEDSDGTNEKVRISCAGEMTRVFNYISHIPVKTIRVVLKCCDWRQSGKKEALVAKVMLHLQLAILSGKNVADSLSAHRETSQYESWLHMRLARDETYPVSIDRLPDEKSLLALLTASKAIEYRRKKAAIERSRAILDGTELTIAETAPVKAGSEITPRTNQLDNLNQPAKGSDEHPVSTQFGLNEFARLLITIRDDEDARSAVIAMGQEPTRAQLDAGVTRGDFWMIVESRFNDPTQTRFLNLSGYVDDVDSSLPPLAHRTATFLKVKFNDAKADFTQYVIRWSASGQNDPDRFRIFLPKLPSGELNALGKRMMVMFVCTRKGTPYEETHFSNVCCKLIPGGAGREEGSRVVGLSTEGATTETQRRKRKSSDSEGVREIASSLSKIASCYEGKRNEKEGSPSEKQLKDYSCRLKKIKILEDVVKKLSSHPTHDGSGAIDTGEASLRIALRKLQQDVTKDLLSETTNAS